MSDATIWVALGLIALVTVLVEVYGERAADAWAERKRRAERARVWAAVQACGKRV